MESGDPSAFWTYPSLIEFLFPCFCCLLFWWLDRDPRGPDDDYEKPIIHDLNQADDTLLSSSTFAGTSGFLSDIATTAESSWDDREFLSSYTQRRLRHWSRRVQLAGFGPLDRQRSADYRERLGDQFHTEGKEYCTVSSSNEDFGDESDLDFEAIAAEPPEELFNIGRDPSKFEEARSDEERWRTLRQSWSRKKEDFQWRDRPLDLTSDGTGGPKWETNTVMRPIRELTLLGLKVIDCFLRHVVPISPHCDYVALSYVWGSGTSRAEDGTFNLDLYDRRLPQTVEDAMNVTRVLGKRYLWVDRYCIDGSDSWSKQLMISNMDRVYKAACLTIIAASGSDGEHGLPNVSGPRKIRDDGTVPPWDGLVRTKLFDTALEQIEQSAWSTRGWTYQEGLLSRRRLVFTDKWVILNDKGEDKVKANTEIFAHINEYSRRRLTYQSDLLKAFLGVFRAYETLRPPAMHTWGVPFLLDVDGNIRQQGYGLLWRTHDGYPLRRIQGLPSWTWAGWSGWSAHDATDLDFDSSLEQPRPAPYKWLVDQAHDWRKIGSCRPSDISIEIIAGGQLTELSDYFRGQWYRLSFWESGDPRPMLTLFLTAWSTTVTAYVLADFSVYLEGEDMGVALAGFDPTVESLCKTESQVNGCWSCEWTAAVICWGNSDESCSSLQTQSLLLKRVGANTFSRIGVLETDWHKSDMDKHGRMAARGRTFTRTCLRIV